MGVGAGRRRRHLPPRGDRGRASRDREDGELLAYDGTDRRWVREAEGGGGFFEAGPTLLDSRSDLDGDALSVTARDPNDGGELWTYEGAIAVASVGETIYGARWTEDRTQLVALRE